MEKHITNYVKYFKIDLQDWIECECGCRQRAEQFHHLIFRSSFGSKRKKEQDAHGNVCYINSECHRKAHMDRAFNEELKVIHRRKMLKASNNPSETVKY